MNTNLKNMNVFNFLRGTSAFFIIIWHIIWITNMHHPDISVKLLFSTPAWVGVWTFFVISGYLIGKGFFNEKYQTNNLKDFGKFYLQRAIRILPIYYLIILIDIFFINTNVYLDLSNHILVRALTMRIAGFGGTAFTGNMWFINVVFQLYLIAPFVHQLVVKPLKKLKHSKIYAGLLILTLMVFEFIMRSVNLGHHSWGNYIYCNVIFNLDVFFCGFLFNFFTQNNTCDKLKQVIMPVSLLTYTGFIVWNMVQMQKHWRYDIGAEDIKIYAVTISIAIVLFLIYAFDFKRENTNERLSLLSPIRWFELLGIISMGLFISHGQTINNLNSIIKFNNDIVWSNNIFGLLAKPLKITISSGCLTLWTITFYSLFFSIIWGIILHYMVEKPINNYRYSLNSSKKKS